jgi:dipeptidyl aminopeptidase/acylaminoacyl peptidase
MRESYTRAIDVNVEAIMRALILAGAAVFGLCACADGHRPDVSPPPIKVDADNTAATIAPVDHTNIESRGNLLVQNVPLPDFTLREQLTPYLNVRLSSGVDFTADGESLIFVTRFGDSQQIHRVKSPGGDRRQLTFADEPIGAVVVSPSDAVHGLVFQKDRGGDENFQLYYMDLDTEKVTQLTTGASRNEAPVFSKNGRLLAYSSNLRNGTDSDIYLDDLTDDKPATLILSQGGTWYAQDFSPDGKSLVVQRFKSVTDATLHVFNLTQKKLSDLPTFQSAQSSFRGNATYAPDGAFIYFLADEETQWRQLYRYEVKGRSITMILPPEVGDVAEFALDPNGRLLASLRNVNGSTQLRIYNIKTTGRVWSQLSIDPGVISGLRFDPAGERLLLTFNGAKFPGVIVTYLLKDRSLVRWVAGETGGLSLEKLVEPKTVVIPPASQMGVSAKDLPMFVYSPPGKGPFPVLVQFHGGPEAQALPTFDALIQFLVAELKIVVITPNVSGSSGYGTAYVRADDGVLRRTAIDDIGRVLDWIAAQSSLDKSRVCTFGGSYGGFMTLASLVNYTGRIRCGVDVVGISNLISFMQNTSPYRRDLRRAEYGDERDPVQNAFMQEISPLTHVDRIKAPLFVVQGKNDPRVPRTEATQIAAAARANGLPVWYMEAADEGHGFKKKTNVDALRLAIVQFLREYLLNSKTAGTQQ